MNHICIIDNSLSTKECDSLIDKYSSKLTKSLKKPWNYSYCFLPYEDKILQKLVSKILPKYETENPEINFTSDSWSLKILYLKNLTLETITMSFIVSTV